MAQEYGLPYPTLFDQVARTTADRIAAGTNVTLASSVMNLTGAVTRAVERTSMWFATSGQQMGQQMMDAAGDAVQQRSIQAMNAIANTVVAQVRALSEWVRGGLRGAFGGLVNNIRSVTGHVTGGAGRGAHGLWAGITGFGRNMGQAVMFGVHNVFSPEANRWRDRQNGQFVARPNFGTVGNFMLGAVSRVTTMVRGLFDTVEGAFRLGWNVARTVGRTVVNVVTGVYNAASTVFGAAWNIARTVGGFVWNAVSGFFQGVGNFFVRMWGNAQRWLQTASTSVMGWVNTMMTGARTVLSNLWSSAVGFVQGLARGIGGFMSSIWSLVSSIPYVGPALQIGAAVVGLIGIVRGVGMLSGVLGTVGQAITGAATHAALWARGAATTAFGWGRSAAGAVWNGASSVATGAWNGGVNMLRGGGAMLGRLPGMGAGGVGWMGGVLQSFYSTVTGVISTIFKFGTAVLTLVGIGVVTGVFIKGVSEAAKAAMEFAKSAKVFSAQSGLSPTRSAGILADLLGLGIKEAPTGNAGMFRLRAGAYGLPGFDSPGFVASFAEKFQTMQSQGMVGQLMASSMARRLGMDSPDWLRVATTRPGLIREQQGYTSHIQSMLGLTPDSLRKYSEEIPLFMSRVGTVWEGLKMKLATTVLPIFQSVLGGVTNWLGQNAQKMGGYIEGAVRFMFVRAPLIAIGAVSTIVSTVQTVVNAAFTFGTRLVTGFPRMLGGMGQWVANSLRNVADLFGRFAPVLIAGVANGLSGFGGMIAGWMRGVGNFISDISTNGQNPLRGVITWVAQAFDGIVSLSKNFIAGLMRISAMAPTAMDLAQLLLPGGAFRVIPALIQRGNDAYNNSLLTTPSSNMVGAANRWLNGPALTNMGSGIVRSADALQGHMNDYAQSWMTNATRAGQRVYSGLYHGADWLDPTRGHGNNLGDQIGNTVVSALRPSLQGLGDIIKPGVDNIANVVQKYQKSLGSEDDRNRRFDEMIAIQKESAGYLRKMATDQKPMPRASEKLVGYLAGTIAEMQGRAELNQGRG